MAEKLKKLLNETEIHQLNMKHLKKKKKLHHLVYISQSL